MEVELSAVCGGHLGKERESERLSFASQPEARARCLGVEVRARFAEVEVQEMARRSGEGDGSVPAVLGGSEVEATRRQFYRREGESKEF